MSDLELYIRERLLAVDETFDVSSGSSLDTRFIQPLLRRLTPDPFSLPFVTFAQAAINQEYPDLATNDGDAITDLLIKTGNVLFDPFLREHVRIRNAQSLEDPTLLNREEASALGGNYFDRPRDGRVTTGSVRLYYSQAQDVTATPANFCTSTSGLHYFPVGLQSISAKEMLLNKEADLYYFDVDLEAEAAGDQYNIEAGQIVSIANMPSVVRIFNRRRFRNGLPEETTDQFLGRLDQSLTQRTLVTGRGIAARVPSMFSEVTRIASTGHGDPEMSRDLLHGGGYGALRAFGLLGAPVPDGEHAQKTRRISLAADGINLFNLMGPVGVIKGWVITLVSAFAGVAPAVRDLEVTRIMSSTELEIADQVLQLTPTQAVWMLRKREITLSSLPGGILFPNTLNGEVAIPDDGVHIGGMVDIHVRGDSLDEETLLLSAVSDETPALEGSELQLSNLNGSVSLQDFIFNTNFFWGDATYTKFSEAFPKGYILEILNGPAAGTYRLLTEAVLVNQQSVVLSLDPAPQAPLSTSYRWRLLDEIDVDLIEPKEIRLRAQDLDTRQGAVIVVSANGTDFEALGVEQGDILRVHAGPDKGDFVIAENPLAPFFNRLKVDRNFTTTMFGVRYTIFRKNAAGGVVPPFVRMLSVELLDTTGQPIGTKVPYAKAVDARSTAFSNVAHGVLVEAQDALLGIVSLPLPNGATAATRTLTIQNDVSGPNPFFTTVTFTGPDPVSLNDLVNQINTAAGTVVAYALEESRLGIAPAFGETVATGDAALMVELFGTSGARSSRDVRSTTVQDTVGWSAGIVKPSELGVLQVLDGLQAGFYTPKGVVTQGNLIFLQAEHDFVPEVSRFVQLGIRSFGTSRVYFLEPTSVTFDANTVFSAVAPDGTTRRFFPDPTLLSQRVPGPPNGTPPRDGSTTGGGSLLNTTVDLLKKAVQIGDTLVVEYVPLVGLLPLADPVPNLALTSLVLSINGGQDKPVTFVRDSVQIPSTDVTRSGVATQINRAAGMKICSIAKQGDNYYLEFEADAKITVRITGDANTLLGFSTVAEQDNTSPHAGRYTVKDVTATDIEITGAFPMNPNQVERQQFKVYRTGTQRVCTTEMAAQVEAPGLYYADVRLVSEGTGDGWDLPADTSMTVEGYTSDGYWLTVDNEALSFSTAEPLHMHMSTAILDVGVNDDAENMTPLAGQNLLLTYERSSLTASIENFASSEAERVVCANTLARHLIPHFVRMNLSYLGGAKTSDMQALVEEYIQKLSPDDYLEVSDIGKILSSKGATSVTNPVDLVAVVHDHDRTIWLDRSKNRLGTTRLAAFIPDAVTLTRAAG